MRNQLKVVLRVSVARALGSLAIVLLVTTPASATPFTWLVEGTSINLQNVGIGGPYDGAFHVGQSYAW